MDIAELAEAVLRSGSDGIVAADRQSNIRFWNPGAERIFGYSADEAVGQSLDIIIPEKAACAPLAGLSSCYGDW
jgi:PAS domain S-box-containing protein